MDMSEDFEQSWYKLEVAMRSIDNLLSAPDYPEYDKAKLTKLRESILLQKIEFEDELKRLWERGE